MEILAKYIHGSEDSTDVDVVYVVDELPDKNECKQFCSTDKNENRNLITVKNGVVSAVYKGTVDEVNNALLDTYSLHEQTYPLLITRKVERCVPLKLVRAVRILLSYISRTHYRPKVKAALRSGFFERVDLLDNIDLTTINFDEIQKGVHNPLDVMKTYAFQIGQVRGLLEEPRVELYTKREIADRYPDLEPFLYRRDNPEMLHHMNPILQGFAEDVMHYTYEKDVIINGAPCVWFKKDNITINLQTEQIVIVGGLTALKMSV